MLKSCGWSHPGNDELHLASCHREDAERHMENRKWAPMVPEMVYSVTKISSIYMDEVDVTLPPILTPKKLFSPR